MTRGGRRLWLPIVLAAQAVAIGPVARAQDGTLQVTLFAIVAKPGSNAIDPKLAKIAPQLRKLLPGHGFKLLDVQSKSLGAGESVRSDLGGGLIASTALIRPLNENGKVELRCLLTQDGIAQFDTLVATPPNQLFFCDRMRADGTRLLIGVGAR
jgi:hypothetical protein